VLISTMNDVPGYRVTKVLGECFGLTVRSRNAFSQFGAGLKSLAGGELKGMTKNLETSREEVVQRMAEEAEARGANAVPYAQSSVQLPPISDVSNRIASTAVVIEPSA
jgi:uncharacterized protein YbjQ (UPF0145 family)